jgi:hypothetical protein
MKRILCLLITNAILILPIFSQTENPENIDIKIKQASNTIPEGLIRGIRLLPIEFRVDAMIKNISKVQFDGNRYYLLNRIDNHTQNLAIITKEGKIDQVLDRRGQGPGEYLMIQDFNIDPQKKDLWTYDGGKQVYFVYSPDLQFIKSFPAKQEFVPGIFLFTPWNPKSILVNSSSIDKTSGKFHGTLSLVTNERFEKTLMDLGESISTYGGYYRLQSLLDAIDFLPPFSSDIIRVQESGVIPIYRITFDAPVIKPGTKITDSMHSEIYNQTFYESEFYILLTWMINGKVYLSFYNKKTHQVTTVQNPWNIKTDEGYLFHILGMVDNKLVLWAINLDVKDVVSKLDPGGKKLFNKEVLDFIDPESQLSNPILVFIDLQ